MKPAPSKKLMEQRIRILMAKAGLDGHDRGVKVVARALRDAGMEVIYTGLHNTPDQVVRAALQEDVDVIGLSILSGAHMTIFAKVVELMKKYEMNDVLLMGGGIIPDTDKPILQQMGVYVLFGPGASTQDIIEFIRNEVQKRRKLEV